jgi:tetratricopeptide (TPR) repeat protein
LKVPYESMTDSSADRSSANKSSAESAKNVEALLDRGVTLLQAGDIGGALQVYDQVLALEPDNFGAHLNIGSALRRQKQFVASCAATRMALALNPESSSAWGNLGNVLKDLGEYAEAIECHTRAVELCAKSSTKSSKGAKATAKPAAEIGAWNNLGVALRAAMRPREAVTCFDKVLALDPTHADARFDRALALLTLGNFKQGWPEYETRWQLKRNPPRQLPGQPWLGEGSLKKKTIFVHAEQGFGDAIQFVRFVPRLQKLGARVVLECRPELYRLFQTVGGIDTLIRKGEPPPDFDFHCPLLSLPAKLDLHRQSDFAAKTPYLHVPKNAGDKFAPALAAAGRRLKVGIAWAGSATFGGDRERSIGLENFLPLAGTEGVRLFSLQIGPGAQSLRALRTSALIADLAPLIEDFADTAAALQALDLMIAVDTSVVHLAGAFGRPAWVLLPFFTDFRWLMKGDDTPWYPSVRLFRMAKPNDWAGTFVQVANDLKKTAAKAAGA